VNADVDGQLTEFHFTEGQYVKKGQPLLTVDSRSSDVNLGQAPANHPEADDQKLAEADLIKDREEESAAEAEADRFDALYRDGVVSKEEDERTRTVAVELESLVKADQDAVTSAKESGSVAEGKINSSTLPRGYHSIRSPIDGLAEKTVVKLGDTVVANDSTPLVIIEQVSPIYVSFAVPEAELPDIDRCRSQGELKVAATIGDDVEVAAPGTLAPIAYATISENGTVALKATFDNKDRRLRPGQPVNVRLTLTTAPDAAVIPSSAVQTNEQAVCLVISLMMSRLAGGCC
jgi:multidrug efflux system membrane fusion protein